MSASQTLIILVLALVLVVGPCWFERARGRWGTKIPRLAQALAGDTVGATHPMNREQQLRRRLRFLTLIIILGLVISGATAIPIEWQLGLAVKWLGIDKLEPIPELDGMLGWLHRVWLAVRDTDATYPFFSYGTDWLAFGHVVIGIAFFGALRDPVRNRWLFQFGMIACVLVIPWAMLFGHIRGIPLAWRLVDCSFGVIGFLPMWLAHRAVNELETIRPPAGIPRPR